MKFPVTIQNTGNIEDNYRCIEQDQTASPEWDVYCEDSDGNIISSSQGIAVAAQSSVQVFMVVSIDGEEELSSSRVTVRIINKDDSTNSGDQDGDGLPDNQREFKFLAILSDRVFAMDVRLVDGGLDQRSGTALLPPSGTQTYGFWVKNTGDGNDKAVFDISGLEGIATRTLTLNGIPVEGSIDVPVGYGIWDQNNSMFLLDSSNEAIVGSTKDAAETQMCELGLCAGGYDARPFEMYFEMELTVNPSAETGDGGILEVVVISTKNAANRSGHFDIALDVQILYAFEFDLENTPTESTLSYPDTKTLLVNITNTGNINGEVSIFSSESFRGWSVDLREPSEQNFCDKTVKEFICELDVGQTIVIKVVVQPPVGAEVSDTYKFTLSAEPVETGVVDRENVEFTITGEVASGWLSLGLESEEAVTYGLGLVMTVLAVFVFRSFIRGSRS